MGRLGRRVKIATCWAFAPLLLLVVGPDAAVAGSFGDYKDEKHDGDSAADGADSDEDDSEDRSDGEDDNIVGGILSALASNPDDDVETESTDPEQSARYAARPCRYSQYRRCVANCSGSDGVCRRECRESADWACGSSGIYGGGYGGSAEPAADADGYLSAGAGLVEAGHLFTAEGVTRWGNFGVGVQSSLMWDSGDHLFESDFGPVVYFPHGAVEYGFQPSLMVSLGNGVNTLWGTGVRTHLRFERASWFLETRPLVGYIGGKLNVHSRTGVGYRFTRKVHLSAGHDFRYVHDFSDVGRSSLHGAFLSVGLDF